MAEKRYVFYQTELNHSTGYYKAENREEALKAYEDGYVDMEWTDSSNDYMEMRESDADFGDGKMLYHTDFGGWVEREDPEEEGESLLSISDDGEDMIIDIENQQNEGWVKVDPSNG